MKRLIVLILIVISSSIDASNCINNDFTDPVIIEITDTTLDNISYHQNSFTEPTKLVFTNLTSVSGSIYFHQNVNLVEVDFPLLQNAGSSVYFHQNLSLVEVDFPLLESTSSYFYCNGNTSLDIINAPSLTTVTNYVSITGNTSLTELNICNLSEIIQEDSYTLPYYNINNNTEAVDADPQCFSIGAPTNLVIDNTTISENLDINSLVGNLSADSNGSSEDLIYYLTEYEFDDNEDFSIVGNQLFTNSSFDYETRSEYNLEIGVRNLLGEKLEVQFTVNIEDVINEDIATIEITDTTLDNVFYHQNSFTEPTKLVFTNLTSVDGSIYFHQNVNLVEVDFPLLESTGSHFYCNGNTSLDIINAPSLTTVTNYVSITGNTSLTELNICNLSEIIQEDSYTLPYYNINNNTEAVDADPQCFSIGAPTNLVIDNTTISENLDINSLVGNLSADSNGSSEGLIYYLTEDSVDNCYFSISGNQIVTSSPLDYETRNEYILEVGVRNQLGEKLESELTINVEDVIDETITIIEITDTTLDNIFYHKNNSFVTPTRLVFTNLTSVSGSIYFHQNINLVEVDFPLLEDTGGYVYFNENFSLDIVNAPVLTTIADYLYVSKNESLTTFNVCNLIQITQVDGNDEPYYYIQNNSNLDISTTCLTITDVIFVPVDEIVIQPVPNTLVGTFISSSTDDSNIQYYFVDDDGNEIMNEDFIIVNNELYLAREYEDYTETNFDDLVINAIRTVSSTTDDSSDFQNRTNTLNEKIELTFSINIDITTLGLNDLNDDVKEAYIYPNPAKTSFKVYSEKPSESVTIYDIAGNRLKVYKGNQEVFYIGNLASGIYLIDIRQNDDSNSIIRRLVID